MNNIQFLTLDDVLRNYKYMIELYGGSYGILDLGRLESALAYPRDLYEYENCDIFQIAAAYCYHIIKNHPFVDGNKRTGLLLTITFLEINNIVLEYDFESLYQFAISVADSGLSKEDIAQFFRDGQKIYKK
jgi:death-on-curing protein